MSSSYNNSCSKHKLVGNIYSTTETISQCPSLQYGATLSGIVMSGLAISAPLHIVVLVRWLSWFHV